MNSKTITDARRYIREHVDQFPLSVHEIADAVLVSERQFYRTVKQETGMTPYYLIRKIRLEYAQDLARRGRIKSVRELARAVGYRRADHFVRLFRKQFGYHPQEALAIG